MTDQISLSAPELLILEKEKNLYLGASQEWYPQLWQRQAGCGPTNCAHLLWYLSQRRPACRPLAAGASQQAEDFLQLMEEIWQYVKPGRMGVNNVWVFVNGARQYAQERGIKLRGRVLEIPALPFKRPKGEVLGEYLAQAIGDDLPVAFMNLSNGALSNLDNWHWVTLVAYQPQLLRATMYDQGAATELDMGLWLRTTSLGGALVALEEDIDSPEGC